MSISEYDLLHQTALFIATYPWVWEIEEQYGLPRGLLLAIGSRETNLTNEVGDYGHGHGVWQLDDRSHTIPSGFDGDVKAQAVVAAQMLAAELKANGGSVDKASDVYNSGRNFDSATTGGDYGTDVAQRLAAVQKFYPAPIKPIIKESGMIAYDPVSGGSWTVRPDGSVFATDGAPYLGGLNNHPEWHAGPAVGIAAWGIGNDANSTGYVIAVDTGGATPAWYRFPRSAVYVK